MRTWRLSTAEGCGEGDITFFSTEAAAAAEGLSKILLMASRASLPKLWFTPSAGGLAFFWTGTAEPVGRAFATTR